MYNIKRLNQLDVRVQLPSELRDRGVIVELGTRKCRATGREAIVWDVTENLPIEVVKPMTKKEKKAEIFKLLDSLEYYSWELETKKKIQEKVMAL